MNELQRYFKERRISTEEVAKRTGYSVGYIRNLLNGSDELNDKARFRLIRAFPDTQLLIIPESVADAQPA